MADQNGDGASKPPNCGCRTGGGYPNGNSFPGGIQGSQLAIFYGGTIHVFDAITPEKAQAVMLIATAAQGAAAAAAAAASASASAQSSTGGSPADQTRPQPPQQPAPGSSEAFCKLDRVLPLMRRNSLQRFLEKRRERCLNTAPYNVSKSKPEHPSPESCSGSESSAPANNLSDASASS